MKTASVKEVEANISQYLKEIDQEDILIIADEKPKAILHRLVGDELEDYVITNSPTIKEDIENAYQEYLDGGGIDLNTLIENRKD